MPEERSTRAAPHIRPKNWKCTHILKQNGGVGSSTCDLPTARPRYPRPRRVGEWAPHRSDYSTAKPTAPTPATRWGSGILTEVNLPQLDHPIQQRLSSTGSILSPSCGCGHMWASCSPPSRRVGSGLLTEVIAPQRDPRLRSSSSSSHSAAALPQAPSCPPPPWQRRCLGPLP